VTEPVLTSASAQPCPRPCPSGRDASLAHRVGLS
jgi:hypothetical protein